LASGQIRQVASSHGPAGRHALLDAYNVAFSTTLNHLMYIGAAVAFVGVICAFVLVRQRDFVVPTAHVTPQQPGQPGQAGQPGPQQGQDTAAPSETPAAVGGGGPS
jgi:hypothetical protein